MFNLVKNRYLFLIISLIVIVPGTLSLIFKGLNVGLDFAGGANVEFRPQVTMKAAEVQNLVKPFNLQDLQIVTGDDTAIAANKTVWVRLNTWIDTNVQASIQNTLKQKYPEVTVNFDDVPLVPPKKVTIVTITQFTAVPNISDIKTLLSKLPDTSDPSKGPPSAAATPTPTVTATATAKRTATAATTPTVTATKTTTPAATATAQGTSTPAATPTQAANNNPANIPVSLVDVAQGQTTQTITILTRTPVQREDVSRLMAQFLNNNGPYIQLISNSLVGASVAAETTRNAVLAVIAASVAILLYIWFSFRKVSKPWRYGTCAIIALLHDVLVVLGVFSILGWLFNIQIDALFITALLTVVGFSVHDTIVVFDRIRENMQRRTSETFEQVVNASLVQTMARSLNTSLTVLFTLTALTLFGGASIRNFTLALLIGIFSGTYSSIFNASMLLVIWEKGELGLGRLRREQTPDGRPVRDRELAGTRR
ncbi:MAG TPA: protein translocase subunit SecF [Ktedonobacteraceae bacterium]|nr:protein translocase subunit SecF [Ktedonobacteraceae bacterium]